MSAKSDFKLTYSTMFDPPAELHARFEAALAKIRPQPAKPLLQRDACRSLEPSGALGGGRRAGGGAGRCCVGPAWTGSSVGARSASAGGRISSISTRARAFTNVC